MEVFEQYSHTYSAHMEQALAGYGAKHAWVTKYKANLIIAALRRHGAISAPEVLLDVGCGIGLIDQHLIDGTRSVHGVDVSSSSIHLAAARCPSGIFSCYDGRTLPFPENSFDATFAVCVLHHIAPDRWVDFVLEMKRVTKMGGLVMVFEHNPYNPVTRLIVNRCEFDRGVKLLTPGKLTALIRAASLPIVERGSFLFTPFQRKWAQRLDGALRTIPFGAQHLIIAKKASVTNS